MKVLVAHNRYRSDQPSGENVVVDAEIDVLRGEGVEVVPFIRTSDDIASMGAMGRLDVALGPIRSRDGVAQFKSLLREHHPDVVHVHNVYPLLSPWIIREAKSAEIPVVMTVHNFRLDCVAGTYLRDGKICTECAGRSFAVPAVRHGCYRGSRLQSLPMVAGRSIHRSTWGEVDRFLALTSFHSQFLESIGIPRNRIVIRPTSVADPSEPSPPGRDVLFVGRLGTEKGIEVLLAAWQQSDASRQGRRLHVAGDGELRDTVVATAEHDASIVFHGPVEPATVGTLMQSSGVVLIPSICFEGLPRVLVESFARGRAVGASDIGGLGTAVDDEVGWRVPANDAASLAETLNALTHKELMAKGSAARHRYLSTYSPDKTTPILLNTYAQLVDRPDIRPESAGGTSAFPA